MDLEDGFKNALATWASGVSVVTARDPAGLVYGLTVSSFASVSLRPPLVSVCISNENRLVQMAIAAKGFAVTILAHGQEEISDGFATRGREPSATLDFPSLDAPGGRPVLIGAAAWVSCDLASAHVEGDHTVLIGRVVATACDPARSPLIYYRRAYRTVTGD